MIINNLSNVSFGSCENVPLYSCTGTTSPTLGTPYYSNIVPRKGHLFSKFTTFMFSISTDTTIEIAIMSGQTSGSVTRLITTGAIVMTSAGGSGFRTINFPSPYYLLPDTSYTMGILITAGNGVPIQGTGPGSNTGKSFTGATSASVIPATESTRNAVSAYIYGNLT